MVLIVLDAMLKMSLEAYRTILFASQSVVGLIRGQDFSNQITIVTRRGECQSLLWDRLDREASNVVVNNEGAKWHFGQWHMNV